MEGGKSALQAALAGSREIAFTVLSMSISLVAVFVPIMFMGDVVGRLFREFAVVMSAAILISMLVSLTTTPTLCALLLRPQPARAPSRMGQAMDRFGARCQRLYRRSLAWCLRHPALVLGALVGVIGLNVFLYSTIEKGFLPEQDTGRISGFIRADQASSYQAMERRIKRFLAIVEADPAVDNVTGFTGGGQTNAGAMFMTLKRGEASDAVIARLRTQLKDEPGARLFMVPQRDIRIGGRQSSGSYDYTLQADDVADLRTWEPRIREALAALPQLEDVNSDVQDHGEQTTLDIDRDALARLGLTVAQVDATLNDAFGQRQVGVIYNPLNQYRVVMEAAPRFLQGPKALDGFFFISKTGQRVPLSAFAKLRSTITPLSVSHEGGTPASTISFGLAQGMSLSDATDAIEQAVANLGVPVSVRGSFGGNAGAFQKALASQPLLILAALVTIYLVLGVLYESLVHPLTILSTLPSAGIGALMALMLFHTEFSLIALIGVFLLIGIVKKNAIMMIDFALARQRGGHVSAAQAIYRAASLRLRPF
jgi:multidrug efflux pump